VTRLTRRLLAGAIVVLIPALAGCEAGLNAPTADFHPAAYGAYDTSSGVTISNAFVLGPAVGQSLPAGSQAGVFLSLYSPGGDTLKSVSSSVGAATIQGGPVNVAAYASVNLTGPTPRIVLTDLSAPLNGGQTITLDLTFANAGPVHIQVPVQPHAYEYSTYDAPSVPASPTASATSTASDTDVTKKHHHHATASPSATPAVSATPSPTAS
jgi:hypothetical protein